MRIDNIDPHELPWMRMRGHMCSGPHLPPHDMFFGWLALRCGSFDLFLGIAARPETAQRSHRFLLHASDMRIAASPVIMDSCGRRTAARRQPPSTAGAVPDALQYTDHRLRMPPPPRGVEMPRAVSSPASCPSRHARPSQPSQDGRPAGLIHRRRLVSAATITAGFTVALRADIDRIIDRVDDVASTCDGVPKGVIRQDITRHETCRCAVMRRFVAEAEKARVAAEPATTSATQPSGS
jgi:hypothetical protein